MSLAAEGLRPGPLQRRQLLVDVDLLSPQRVEAGALLTDRRLARAQIVDSGGQMVERSRGCPGRCRGRRQRRGRQFCASTDRFAGRGWFSGSGEVRVPVLHMPFQVALETAGDEQLAASWDRTRHHFLGALGGCGFQGAAGLAGLELSSGRLSFHPSRIPGIIPLAQAGVCVTGFGNLSIMRFCPEGTHPLPASP
jgi:hypothetical protein